MLRKLLSLVMFASPTSFDFHVFYFTVNTINLNLLGFFFKGKTFACFFLVFILTIAVSPNYFIV